MSAYTEREQRIDSDSWPKPRILTGNVTVLIPVVFTDHKDDPQAALQRCAEFVVAEMRHRFRGAELVDTELDGTDADARGVGA